MIAGPRRLSGDHHACLAVAEEAYALLNLVQRDHIAADSGRRCTRLLPAFPDRQ